MMVRVEGPIVDSFYDMFLISWNIALEPPLPMLESPARDAEPPSLKPKTSKLSSVINGAKIHPFG
jgi:phosphatidylserine/phosphatidylglycerophosphate/cardiolipin synthase-like enzyme